jgi:alpha 1,3-glucosidase
LDLTGITLGIILTNCPTHFLFFFLSLGRKLNNEIIHKSLKAWFYCSVILLPTYFMKYVGVCVAVLALLALLLTPISAVDRHKFRKCQDSSFCRRHRGLDPSNLPFQYSIDKSSVSLDGSTLKAVVEEQLSKTQLNLELTLLDSNIIHLRMDEKSPLNSDRRYRVKDVINEKTATLQNWKSWDDESSTLYSEGGKVVLDASKFKIDFFHGENLAVTLNERGLFYLEPLGMARPEKKNSGSQRSLQSSEDDFQSQESEPQVEFGPDGNVIHGKREHVGAVERDLDKSTENFNEDGKRHLASMEIEGHPSEDAHGISSNAIEMDGAWEETFKGNNDPKKRGPESLGMDFTFHGAKHIYGLPEHAIGLDLPATKGEGSQNNRDPYRLFNLDVFEYELNSEMALYGAVPILYAHDVEKTSAVFWLNAAETWVDIEKPHKIGGILGMITDHGSEERVLSHFMSESGIVDVYIILGSNPKEVLEKYRILTGGSELPPYSAIGHHQCRWNYRDENDVLAVNDGFEKHGIPMDYIWLDIEHTDGKKYFTWDPTHFPTPGKMLAKMAEYGRSMVTIIDPHIKRDSGYHVHATATEKGFYIKNSAGHDFDGHCWPGSSGYLDFFNPEVRKWWASLFDYDSYKGSAPNLFTWNDMNEPSVFSGPEVTMPRDAVHVGDVEHRHVHNQYGAHYHLSTAEGLISRDAIQNVHDRHRPFVLTRAFFAGSQRRGTAVWTGDNTAEWGHLKISVPMVMSLGLGGIPFTGADVGGFFKDPSPELMARWYQLGAFYPFFRAHGHIDTKRREPWLFEEPFLSVIRDAVRLRYTILPYLYTQFYYAYEHLTPILRPLFIEYPKDPITFANDDTFLLGSDILVHPVTSQGATHVDVYLPGEATNVWYDFTSHHRYHAGNIITVETPLSYIPIFLRGGSIISIKERLRRSTSQMKDDPFSLIVALDEHQNADGTLYLDDGETFQYQNNQFQLLSFHYTAINAHSHTITMTKSSESPNKLSIANQKINKISIVGIQKAPKEVSLSNAGHITNVEFEFDSEAHRLILRNPNNAINESWTFEITF